MCLYFACGYHPRCATLFITSTSNIKEVEYCMDYRNQAGRPVTARPFDGTEPVNGQGDGHKGDKKRRKFNVSKIGFIFIVVVASVMLIGLLTLLFTAKGNSTSDQIQSDKYQAVFLNSQDGQVYFGRLSVLNKQYYKLTDIYYVRVDNSIQPDNKNTSTSQQNISLAKLGNEIHGPQDVMYVNKDHVLFWENLKDDGQVVKAILEYKKNPTSSSTDTTTQSTQSTTNSTNKTNTTR